jgi:hypothetical protein
MEHVEDIHFKGNAALPLSSSALNSLFLPRFRQVDIAELIPLIWSNFGSGSYSRVVSSLVNVCSPFSGFSTGHIEIPRQVYPPNSHIIFTFNVRAETEWEFKSLQFTSLSNKTVVWGSGHESRKFISIGLSSIECSKLGLLHIQSSEINYLYRLVGIIFRSVFIHYSPSEVDDLKRGTQEVNTSSPFKYRDNYLTIPLSAIVRFPYRYWKYNRNILKVAPNVVTHTNVDVNYALYYFMFLTEFSKPRATFDGMSRLLGIVPGKSQGLLDVLLKSVMAFSQYLKSADSVQLELLDLLAANVIVSMLYTSKSKIIVNKNTYWADLEMNTLALAQQLKNLNVDKDVLAPYETTAKALLLEDPSIFNKLLSNS